MVHKFDIFKNSCITNNKHINNDNKSFSNKIYNKHNDDKLEAIKPLSKTSCTGSADLSFSQRELHDKYREFDAYKLLLEPHTEHSELRRYNIQQPISRKFLFQYMLSIITVTGLLGLSIKLLFSCLHVLYLYNFFIDFIQGNISYQCKLGGSPFESATCNLINSVNSVTTILSSHFIESLAALFTSRNMFDVFAKFSGYFFVIHKTILFIDPFRRILKIYMKCIDTVYSGISFFTDVIFFHGL